MSVAPKKPNEEPPIIVSTSSSGSPKRKQSPVDLNRIHTWTKNFPPLRLYGHWHKDGIATMRNTGQTVKIEFSHRATPSIFGGPLGDNDCYRFANLEFRWGPENCGGAEHSIDNLWYSMEAQAIHWNNQYETMEKCYEKSDGFAILSCLLQVVGCPENPDNPYLADITNHLPKIKKPGSTTMIPSECLRWMSEACLANGYYTYEGSLTTPPYNECATWIVIPRPVKISARQEFHKFCNKKTRREYRKNIFQTDMIGLMKKGSSPINLDDRHVKLKKFAPLILNGHWLKDGDAYLSNNGETAMIHLTGNRIPSTVTGGPLVNDDYEFINTHFHWRKDNCNGSEHQINGTWFSLEAHVVHWNRKYYNFKECLKHRDGLAILTYFFLVVEKNCEGNNPLFDKVTENLKYVVEPDAKVKIPANCLCWMRDATHCPRYYTYSGTYNQGNTPECATWMVFPLIIPISACQIEEFRKLRNRKGEQIMDNCKNLQTPNGRRVFLVKNVI